MAAETVVKHFFVARLEHVPALTSLSERSARNFTRREGRSDLSHGKRKCKRETLTAGSAPTCPKETDATAFKARSERGLHIT